MAKPKERIYTEQQSLFLEALRDPDNKGNIKTCMKIAGYGDQTPSSVVVKALGDEMIQIANDLLAAHAPQAAMEMVGVFLNPGLQSRQVIAAAKEILDRTGVKKSSEDVKIKVGRGIVILPAKENAADVYITEEDETDTE